MADVEVEPPASFLDHIRRQALRLRANWWRPTLREAEAPTNARRDGFDEAPADGEGDDPDGAGEGPTCRICLSGQDPQLGRLFSPCLCKGTMAKVHVECLSRWRITSRNSKSFWECNSCHYRYRIGRTKIAGLATNPLALFAMTLAIFFVLCFITGLLGSVILRATNALPRAPFLEDVTYFFTGTPSFSPWYFWGDVLSGSVGDSLRVFSDLGEVAVGKQAHPFDPDRMQHGNFISRAWEDMMHNVASRSSPGSEQRMEPWGAFIIMRSISGFALLGIMSFLQIMISFSLLGPLHHLRLFRRARDRGRAGERRGTAMSLIIVAAVLIGTVRAIRTLYRFVERRAKWTLGRVEEVVLEVR